MYDSDPFQGLPTRLDAFGRKVVDESRLTPSQWIQWKQAQQDHSDLASTPAREEPLKPWRGIATETLPSDIKSQLKPHWRNWVVANPEYARYRGSGGDIRIFAIDSKGVRQVQSLSDIQIGQKHYVLRRQKTPKTRPGGGGAAATKTQKDPIEQEVQQLRKPSYVRIEHPTNHSKFAAGKPPLQGEGPYTLKVDGTYSNGDGLTLYWENLDTGRKGQSGVESYPNRAGEPWKGEICGLGTGRHRITIRNAQGNSDQVTIRIEPFCVAEILYETGTNTFHLLSEEDYAAFQEAAGEFDAVIRTLEQAHLGKSEKQLNTAKAQVDQKLKGLVNAGGESSLLTEVVGFRGKKFTYVRSEKINNHWRSYKVDKEMKDRSLCGPDGKLNFDKLKEKFKPQKPDLKYTWDIIEPDAGSLNDWADQFNKKPATILWPKDDPERNFDASAQAQLLRYAYGVSLKSNFDFSDKTFGIKLEGSADIAAAEGKINGNWYIPKAEGHKVAFDYTVQNNRGGNTGQVKHFDLGHMRFKVEGCLYGFAGASCQASAGAYFEYKPGKGDEKGRMQLRGSTKGDEGFAGAGGEAFVGAKVGGEITGNGEWKNPEKENEWAALVSIGAEGNFAGGVGIEGKFYISYEQGKFRVRAKAGMVWGFGGGGGFVFSVNVDTIAEFCMFIYHQLKNNDFNFLDLLSEDAFKYFNLLRSYVLLVGEPLEQAYREGREYWGKMADKIDSVLDTLENANTQQKAAEKLAEHILQNPDLVLFQPPESKGRLLRNLCYSHWSSFEETQEKAMIAVLKTIQTWNEYKEVMEHLTSDGRRIKRKPVGSPDNTYLLGEMTLWEFLDGVEKGEFLYHKLRLFMERREKLPQDPQLHTAAIRDNGIVNA